MDKKSPTLPDTTQETESISATTTAEDVSPNTQTSLPAEDVHSSHSTEPVQRETESLDSSDTVDTSDTTDSSDTPSQGEPSETEQGETSSSPKGSVLKKTVGVLVLATLAGGGYYAHQHNYFGLLKQMVDAPNVANSSSATNSANSSNVPLATNTDDQAQASSQDAESGEGEQNTSQKVLPEVGIVVESQDTSSTATENASTTVSTNNASSESSVNTASSENSTNISSENISAEETPVGKMPQRDSSTTSASLETDSHHIEQKEIPDTGLPVANSSASEFATELTSESGDAIGAVNGQTSELTTELSSKSEVLSDKSISETSSIALSEVINLYQAANFELTVRVSKENALKVLDLLKKHLALQSEPVWNPLKQAVDRDIQTLQNAEDIDLEKLFKASNELAQLVQQAPFMSAEKGEVILHPEQEKAVVSETEPGSWLDLAINQVERLPGQAYDAIRSDLGGLIRVEKLSDPDVATLPIAQLQLLRQEALLQISVAQEALLKRQDAVWKTSIQKVEQSLKKYFNSHLETTQQALAIAHQLAGTSIQSQLPALSHTQQALEQLTRQLHKQ